MGESFRLDIDVHHDFVVMDHDVLDHILKEVFLGFGREFIHVFHQGLDVLVDDFAGACRSLCTIEFLWSCS